MTSYGFCFRPSTRRGGGSGKLYLRVVHGGQSRSVTTGYSVHPEEWDHRRRRLIIPYQRNIRAMQLSDYETAMLGDLRRLEGVITKMNGEHGRYDIDTLMERFRSVMGGDTFCDYARHLASELESNGNGRTAKAYMSAAYRLRRFIGGHDFKTEQITPAMISAFQAALRSDGVSMNTVSFYMRTLRAIYHKAVAEGRIPKPSENPFAGVYTGVPATRKLALTSEELAALSALDPELAGGESVPPVYGRGASPAHGPRGRAGQLPLHLRQALAMFLFCYHARGMCFVDMAHLKKRDLRGDTITYNRRKTGQMIEIRVQPALRRIIEWFAPQTARSEYVFPIITDPGKNTDLQYESGLRLQNQRLKKLASMAGIHKRFSTHAARHSWATVAKNAGLSLAVISEGLGHTNQKTTQIYLASLERSVIDHASRVVSDAIRPRAVALAGQSGRGRGRGRPRMR